MNTPKVKPFVVRCVKRGAHGCNFGECWYPVLPTRKRQNLGFEYKNLAGHNIHSKIVLSKYLNTKMFL
jgi:hypothetical protein